jgi:hypothetical protein
VCNRSPIALPDATTTGTVIGITGFHEDSSNTDIVRGGLEERCHSEDLPVDDRVDDTIKDNTAAMRGIQTAVEQNGAAVERLSDRVERLDGRERCGGELKMEVGRVAPEKVKAICGR